jgi:iron complex outermembrane recepter protein
MAVLRDHQTRSFLEEGIDVKEAWVAALVLGVGLQGANAPAMAQETVGIEEVVVTAQRRAENIQRVPVAVTAISEQALENSQIVNFVDVPQLAPSLQFTGGSLPFFGIRGVGTLVFDPGVESSVGVLLDDVPQILPRTPFLNTLSDVQRIEVLRGPQGNLFGKNASAGAISITTKSVDLTGFSNETRLSYGTKNDIVAINTLNAPLGESVGTRVTIAYKSRDGFVRNRLTGEDLYERRDLGVNAKLRWTPGNWNIEGIADFQRHRDNAHATWTVRSVGTGIANTPFIPGNYIATSLAQYGITPGPENTDGAWDGPAYNRTTSLGFTLKADYDFGNFTLTSVSGWRDLDYSIQLDTDSSPLPFYSINSGDIDAEQLTQELRISSNAADGLQYVAGLFYSRMEAGQDVLQAGTYGLIPATSTFRLGNVVPGVLQTFVEPENLAAFGNVSMPLTDNLRVIVGGRVTRDRFPATFEVLATPNICLRAAPGPAQAIAGTCINTPRPAFSERTLSETDWSGSAGFQFNVNDDIMTYAKVARGYKGPAIVVIANQTADLNAETSLAYEAGVKAQFFDRRLVTNVALFQTTYEDFQANTITTFQGTNINATGNAGELRLRGVELETQFSLTDALTGAFNVTYNDTEFLDYLAPCYPGQTAAQGCQPAVAATPTSPAIPARFQAAGNPLTNAPEWTMTGSFAFEQPITSRLGFEASVNANYRSSVIYSVGNEGTKQDGYTLVNANVALASQDGRWRAGIYGRNLFDQSYVTQIAPNIGDNRGGTGFVVGFHNRPTEASERTVGINVDFNF